MQEPLNEACPQASHTEPNVLGFYLHTQLQSAQVYHVKEGEYKCQGIYLVEGQVDSR